MTKLLRHGDSLSDIFLDLSSFSVSRRHLSAISSRGDQENATEDCSLRVVLVFPSTSHFPLIKSVKSVQEPAISRSQRCSSAPGFCCSFPWFFWLGLYKDKVPNL